MNDNGFRQWLFNKGQAPSSVSTRISDARRLEKHFGDLDKAFEADGFSALLSKLAYTSSDRDAGKPNESGIEIDGDIYNSLAAFRGVLSLYSEFRSGQPAVTPASQADRIRQFVLAQYLVPAKERGQREFTVRVGDVHDAMALTNAMPAVCSALDSKKFSELAQADLRNREGPANSSTVKFTFAFRDAGDPLLDRSALERLRVKFLERYRDFAPGHFAKSQGRYYSEERSYKDALISLARQAMEDATNDPVKLGGRLLDVITGEAGAPSGLLGWRTDDHIAQIRKENGGALEREVGQLALAGDSIDAIEQFVNAVWPLLSAGQKSKPYGESRGLPTMLLALIRPNQVYPINSDAVWRVAKEVTGQKIYGLNPLTRQEYEAVLGLVSQIRDIIDKEWGWEPRDLWDVQGFVREVGRTAGAESNGGDDMPLTREAVQQAMHECDQLTTERFLAAHGFGRPSRYWIRERGTVYPAKAIASVAHKYLPAGEVQVINATRAKAMLEELGFEVVEGTDVHRNDRPTNLILYGPPGTGKTYQTAHEAVRLCKGGASNDREELMEEYRKLVASGRIEFVTFHQSYSYEEFVEGLRPVQSDGGESVGFHLEPEPGTFRRIARRAETSTGQAKADFSIGDRQVFKMSIGEVANPDDAHLFEEALSGRYALLGFADIDWSDPKYESRDAMIQAHKEKLPDEPEPTAMSGRIQCPFIFRNVVKEGDVIVVSKGNALFRAIGLVTGGYEHVPREGGGYAHRRAVEWLWHDRAGVSVEEIYARKFTQRSIYSLALEELNVPALERYVASNRDTESSSPEPFVLIIDEINRANISKVFGELITLIEPDKRIGGPNELRVRLPYSKEVVGVPANLHIIGTMNTADRSIALLDTALRRRFEFRELMPDASALKPWAERAGINLEKMLVLLNERIEYFFDREHQIGHAYFIGCNDRSDVDAVMRHKIIPLLAEYFYEDWSKVAAVLGDARGEGKFLFATALARPSAINDEGSGEPRYRWTVRDVFAGDAYDQFQ